jgi:hypothetical protein
MQVVKCGIGMWNVEAKLEDMNDSKRMAIISAMAELDRGPIESKHVVVFDHIQGCDDAEETKAVMNRILRKAH